MGQFTAKKAPKRDSIADLDNRKRGLEKDAKASGAESKQEEFTGRGVKKVNASTAALNGKRYTDTQRDPGPLVRIGTNEKGTDTLKDPLNAYRAKTFPAVENPDGERQKNANGYSQPKAPNANPNGRPRL